jgi:bifunctional DNA-binding transcriptional regulator/antitoxin component of YhaV-PrlF toxin-antitoxin module
MSIPISLRRRLDLDKFKKALVDIEDERIIIEPVSDVLELGRVLYKKALKGKSIDKIIKIEENAAAEKAAEKYRKKQR